MVGVHFTVLAVLYVLQHVAGLQHPWIAPVPHDITCKVQLPTVHIPTDPFKHQFNKYEIEDAISGPGYGGMKSVVSVDTAKWVTHWTTEYQPKGQKFKTITLRWNSTNWGGLSWESAHSTIDFIDPKDSKKRVQSKTMSC